MCSAVQCMWCFQWLVIIQYVWHSAKCVFVKYNRSKPNYAFALSLLSGVSYMVTSSKCQLCANGDRCLWQQWGPLISVRYKPNIDSYHIRGYLLSWFRLTTSRNFVLKLGLMPIKQYFSCGIACLLNMWEKLKMKLITFSGKPMITIVAHLVFHPDDHRSLVRLRNS